MNYVQMRHLQAVIDYAHENIARTDWHERPGTLYALLREALPFLEQLRDANASAVETSEPCRRCDAPVRPGSANYLTAMKYGQQDEWETRMRNQWGPGY